jgi:glycosyltransferase involved in cell wall biosynthesis
MTVHKIRVVHLITSLNTGGSETMLLRLLAQMDPERFENQVISLIPSGPISQKITALGIPTNSLGMKPGVPDPAGFFRLTSYLRRIRPDILQTWLYHADILGLIAGRLSGVPCIVWNVRSADMDMRRYNLLSGITRKLCALLSPLPDAVIINSRAGQAFHSRIGYRPRKWELIPNGIPTQRFRSDPSARRSVEEEFGIMPGTFLAGAFARYDGSKDFPTLLSAASLVKKHGKLFHLLLAGDNIDNANHELMDLIKASDLGDVIHLLGRRDDIPRLAAALDVYISASYTEGFPNAVAEAMACGVPCIATHAGDSAEIIGDTGFVVPTRDPQKLASAWARMIDLPADQRNAMGQNAQNRIRESFSIEAISKKYETLYKELFPY